MSITIVATVGSASANSYITLADAETHMSTRLNADAWDDATDEDKKKALVTAQIELTFLPWKGDRTDDVQALAWPRRNVPDPENPFLLYFADTVMPDRIAMANAEYALEFLKMGTVDAASLDPKANLRSRNIDVIHTAFVPPSQRLNGIARFQRVHTLVKPLMINGETGNIRLRRG